MENIKSSLLKQCGDERIPIDKKLASKKINWDQFEESLKSIGSVRDQKKALELKFERTVKVYKDDSENFHREYVIKDSILQQVLRRSPPDDILNKLTEISLIYSVSKSMYDIIDEIPLEDTDWNDVKRQYYYMRKKKQANGCALSEEEVQEVFLLRHGWREDTILMLSSRRRPPLRFVQHLLEECPESISLIDTPLYDWIPMIYAIAYNASPEVITALIPSSNQLRDFEYLTSLDVYDRTPLHWAVYYGASLESVIAITKASGDDALKRRDGKKNLVFETAIKEGASMDIVKVLIPPGIDFDTVERNIVRSCIWNDDSRKDLDGYEVVAENDDEVNELKTYHVSAKNFPYLAKAIARKRQLQQVLRHKSCTTMATATIMLDFYSCVLLVYSFRVSTTHYLKVDDPDVPLSLFILLGTLIYMTVRELGQFYVSGIYWFTSIWNYFDILTVICGFCTVYRMLNNNIKGDFGDLVVGTTALVFLNALFFLRSTFLGFSVFISGMSKIIWDLIPFLGVTLLLLMAFGEMYMAENWANGRCGNDDGNEATFCSFGESMISTFDFFLGGIPISEYSDSRMMTIISIFYGFLVTIVLMNVLIAIVSASWAGVHQQGKEVYWEYRLVFLSEVKSYEKYLCLGRDGYSCSDRLMKMLDKCLDKICQCFWLREYWGKFDSIIDRVTSKEYGGLSWQFRYDYGNAESRTIRVYMVAKTCMLLAIFYSVLLFWFIAGILTIGVFWPVSIRRFIFGQLIIEDKTELEDISEQIKKVVKGVKDICNDESQENR